MPTTPNEQLLIQYCYEDLLQMERSNHELNSCQKFYIQYDQKSTI